MHGADGRGRNPDLASRRLPLLRVPSRRRSPFSFWLCIFRFCLRILPGHPFLLKLRVGNLGFVVGVYSPPLSGPALRAMPIPRPGELAADLSEPAGFLPDLEMALPCRPHWFRPASLILAYRLPSWTGHGRIAVDNGPCLPESRPLRLHSRYQGCLIAGRPGRVRDRVIHRWVQPTVHHKIATIGVGPAARPGCVSHGHLLSPGCTCPMGRVLSLRPSWRVPAPANFRNGSDQTPGGGDIVPAMASTTTLPDVQVLAPSRETRSSGTPGLIGGRSIIGAVPYSRTKMTDHGSPGVTAAGESHGAAGAGKGTDVPRLLQTHRDALRPFAQVRGSPFDLALTRAC